MDKDPGELIPLKPVELHILVALLEKDSHGYGIVQAIADRTNGAIRLLPGNLYPILHRLERDELVAELDTAPAAEPEHSQRRYYTLTELGRAVAALELARLKSLVEAPDIARLLSAPAHG